MILVDSFLVFQQLIDVSVKEGDFYASLAEELIDNNYDSLNLRKRGGHRDSPQNPVRHAVMGSPDAIGRDGRPRSGLHIHLTPTKRKRKGTQAQHQGRCKICKFKTSEMCSFCKDESGIECWLCHSKTGRGCFAEHVSIDHP